MKKIYAIVILLSMGITQIYAQCHFCIDNLHAVTIGTNTNATGENSFAGGYFSLTSAKNSFVFGNESFVEGLNGIALGNNAVVSFADGIAIGSFVKSNALNSLVFGTATSSQPLTNSKPNSLMFGVTSLPSLTIVKPDGAALGYVGIGTDDPQEMAHVVGTLLIDRTEDVASSLQFKHPMKRGLPPEGPQMAPYYWDIYSDTYGLKFNTARSNGIETQRMIISAGGSVGIGIDAPKAKLHVDQNILAEGNITTLKKFVFTPEYNANSEYWEISRTSAGLNYAYMEKRLQDVLFLGNDGNIGIGKTDPEATLDVNGSFRAKDAIVSRVCSKEIRVVGGDPCWPDFVFSKDYQLLPLVEVEQFITENQHLPNVPSAAEVEANGFELGEMNAMLLQKVEELTLYIIQMEKRLAEVEKQKGND